MLEMSGRCDAATLQSGGRLLATGWLMTSEPHRNYSKAAFALGALLGAVPGCLIAVVLGTIGKEDWSLPGIVVGVPLGVWAATTAYYRYRWRGLLVVMLWVAFAYIVFYRWFMRD
jgi:hypothetical protein